MNRRQINQCISAAIWGFITITGIVACFSHASADCPIPAANGRQPFPAEMVPIFNRAGANLLGDDGPNYPQIRVGYPDFILTSPSVPSILLKAIGYTESNWKQFQAAYGKSGSTVISFDCGYGIMQITSGMSGGAGFDPNRVASEYVYNIGTGAKILIDKWNSRSSYIGERDSRIIEEWYYAVWAYNGWAWINNPNNPKYDPNRPPFNGTQPRGNYPYQELVWGYAANSPGNEFWQSVPLTLPDRNLIGNNPPEWIPRPAPYHSETPYTIGQNAPNPQLFIDCYNRVVSYEGKSGYELFGDPTNEVHRWGNGYIQDFRKDGNELAIMKPDSKNEAYAIYGSIWSKYKELAFDESDSHTPPSYLGYPTSDEREASQSGAEGFDTQGRVQDFEYGHLHYLRKEEYEWQTFETHGAIDGVYMNEGGCGSWLGFPTSDEYKDPSSGYARSDFEGGYITTLDGIDYRASRKQPTKPFITAYSITPLTANPGDALTIKYTINNPTSESISAALGCSIQKSGTTNWISDPNNDKVVDVVPGSDDYSREFVLPSTLDPGKYNVAWGLWNSDFTTKYDYKQSDNYLSVIEQGPTYFFADLNCDGEVNIEDVRMIASCWDTQVGDYHYNPDYDFYEDDKINLLDVRMVAQYWGQSAPFNSAAPSIVHVNSNSRANLVYLQTSSPEIRISETVTVTLLAEVVEALQGMEFHLSYDSKKLQLVGIVLGDCLRQQNNSTPVITLGPKINHQQGTVTIGAVLLGKEKATAVTSKELATIKLTAYQEGESTVVLQDINLINGDENLLLPVVMQQPLKIKITPLAPHTFALGQNFPNPFNPDTWIPYQLAKPSNVEIRIYNISGRLIRNLDLGYKNAGYYQDRASAAYWDGRNEFGEYVANGIYFYALKADKFIATRRMIIGK